MFRHVYEVGTSVLLLQGALLIPLVVLAGFVCFRQMARLEAVEAAVGRDRKRRDGTIASLLKALPKLKPLNCPACGGVLSLGVSSMTCVSCRASFPPPPDYAATMSLRRRLKRLARAALRHWYLAWVLTSLPVRLFFMVMVVGEPALFMITMIGAVEYPDSWLERWFAAIGEKAGMALVMMSFGGFILWMIVFLMLGSLSRDLRRKLPVFPSVARADAATTEFATCRACGGGIHYDGRAFAALCGYCSVENYRGGFARRARAKAEGERAEARATLFAAMEIVEGYVSTFFFAMAILLIAFLLLVGLTALKHWMNCGALSCS